MKDKIIEIIGWYGVMAILGAYALVSFLIVKPTSMIYLLLSFTGGIAVVLDAWKDKNYQPVVLNIIWALIALIAIFRIFI